MSSFFSSAPKISFIPVSRNPINSTTVSASQVVEGLTPELAAQVEAKAQLLISLAPVAGEQSWEEFYETDGVKAIRKPGSGALSIIRSETVIPYHSLDIFAFLTKPGNLSVMDPAIKSLEIVRKFSLNSWVNATNIDGVMSLLSLTCIGRTFLIVTFFSILSLFVAMACC
jgi:hypothetical protein